LADQTADVRTLEVRIEGLGPADRTGGEAAAAPRLAGTLYLPSDGPAGPISAGRPGLLVGHGAGSRRQRHDDFCRVAAACGMVVLAFDFRGHGESQGLVDGHLADDVVAAAQELRRHPQVDPARLGFRGSSMGGNCGIHAAGRAGLAALAVLCPASEAVLLKGLRELEAGSDWPQKELELRMDGRAMHQALGAQDIYTAARSLTCPVLLLHCRGDRVVPLEVSLDLAQALAGPAEVVIVPGGDHTSLQGTPAVHRRVAAWLSEELNP
jgi:dipeptidyl aminopeptidase/acylaminoacyl peptidase